MDPNDALKARIQEVIPDMTFYSEAEGHSRVDTPLGVPNRRPPFHGNCHLWSDEAMIDLTDAGLDVLYMATKTGDSKHYNHFFLLVRDPESGAVVYYDPTAEQFGVPAAHRQTFTRAEIEQFNSDHHAHWLEKPQIYKGQMVENSLAYEGDIEVLRAKWRNEILAADIREQKASKRPSSDRLR